MNLLKELGNGDRLIVQALVGQVTQGTNKSGAPYLNIELKDSSGSLPCKKWEVEDRDFDIFITGNVVEVLLEVLRYNESLQGKVISARSLNADDVDVSRFVKAPPIKKEELIMRFNKLVDSVKDKDCKAILDYFIKKFGDQIYIAPAGTSLHHEFGSGLLMHSIYLAEHVDYFSKCYNDINRDLAVTGALIHDFGKMIELEGPAVYKYSTEGKLLGHISIMCAELRIAAEKLNIKSEVPLLLEHIILSHHGQHEFGSPVLPMTKEALLISMLDNLDSKLNLLDRIYDGVKPGEFSQKIPSMDGRSFYKAK